MNKECNLTGLIIRITDIGEADRYMTILTPDQGKVTILGKGVRSIRSHRLHTSQLFCYCQFTVTQKGEGYYLREANLIEDFYPIREDIEGFALAQYIAETLGILTLEGENQEEILRLSLNTLYMLSTKKKSYACIKATFELRFSALLGFLPDLTQCSECGTKDDPFFLDIENGCVVCQSCYLDHTNGQEKTPIRKPVLETMRYILSAPPKRIFAFTLDQEGEIELSDICEKYFLFHTDRQFETLHFWKTIMR